MHFFHFPVIFRTLRAFWQNFNISTEFYFQSGGSLETASLPDGSKRRFDDLMSHQREIVRDSGRMEAFGSFFTVLQDCLGESLPPKPEVLEIYGRILINSFNIMDDEYQPLGNFKKFRFNRIT